MLRQLNKNTWVNVIMLSYFPGELLLDRLFISEELTTDSKAILKLNSLLYAKTAPGIIRTPRFGAPWIVSQQGNGCGPALSREAMRIGGEEDRADVIVPGQLNLQTDDDQLETEGQLIFTLAHADDRWLSIPSSGSDRARTHRRSNRSSPPISRSPGERPCGRSPRRPARAARCG